MISKSWRIVLLALLSVSFAFAANSKQDEAFEAGRGAYENGDYNKAAQILKAAATKAPQNGEIQLLLAKAYFELEQYDAAISSAEKAVASDPKSSVYHEWLGRTYGEKADHAGPFAALSLAKKTHREFETAVQLDEKNFSARQALIEFDCSAPGIAGGGEDKARPEIEKLAAMDTAEGHYAAGNCRRQKKDFATADVEFKKALESQPRSAELIYDIGDYAMKRSHPELLIAVANAGEKANPGDPRGKFYRAVALILENDRSQKAAQLLRAYLQAAPIRTAYPRPAVAHQWLGRLLENQNQAQAAAQEYQAALRLDPKNKTAHEALKRLGKS